MAKEIAISKRIKITEAQEYIILSVLVAGLLLGAAVSIAIKMSRQIAYNAKVIDAANDSIAEYSEFISAVGICKLPKGEVYTKDELDKCTPNNIDVEEVQGSLRYNILMGLASNTALNSVSKSLDSGCINSDTNAEYTYEELEANYESATTGTELMVASELITRCSAIRIIPEALPSDKNEFALMASLNQIFNLSDWVPSGLSPSEDTAVVEGGNNLNSIAVSFAVDSDTATANRVLSNIERSIREFDIQSATFEWEGGNSLNISLSANAYYMNKTTVSESKTKIPVGDKKK